MRRFDEDQWKAGCNYSPVRNQFISLLVLRLAVVLLAVLWFLTRNLFFVLVFNSPQFVEENRMLLMPSSSNPALAPQIRLPALAVSFPLQPGNSSIVPRCIFD